MAAWGVKKKLLKLVEGDRRFRCIVPGKGFFCPYCSKLAPAATNSKEKYAENLITHVTEACDKFKGIETTPLINYDALEKKKRYYTLRSRALKNPSWRIVDKDSRWYCPFCAVPTNVQYSGTKADMNELVTQIIKHLETCFQFSQDPNKFKSVEELKAVVAQVHREKGMIEGVRKRIESGDLLFRQKSSGGQWICPYCLQVMEHISMASDFLTEHTAPSQITTHLLSSCPVAAEGGKIKSIREVEEVVASHVDKSEESPGGRQLSPTDTIYFDSLKSELMAIRESIQEDDELKRSLDKAKEVVKSMLPKELPEHKDYEFACYYNACSHVGGDFYDFIQVDSDKIGIAIGDVSGHGLDAALVMGMTKKALKLRSGQYNDPEKVMAKTNVDVFSDLPKDVFITCFYGLLDPATHTMHLCRAGHNFTLVYRVNTGEIDIIKEGCMPLGMISGIIFEKAVNSTSFTFGEGDIFLQYTDGLTEAMNKKKEEFGLDRVVEAIKQYGKYDTDYLVDKIVKVMEKFRDGYPQKDDVTVIAIRRKKKGE